MNAQVKDLSPVEAFVTDCLAYSGNSIRIAALKEEQAGLVSANGELRKKIVPFFKEHKDEKWSSLGKSIKAAIVAAGVKDVDGLLGVLKTSFEYSILPTEQNADRLRKRGTWVSWSGMVIPNTYGKVHKTKPELNTPKGEEPAINVSDKETEKQVDALMDTIEKQIQKEDTKKLNAIGNALALATMEATTPTTATPTTATPQKPQETSHPLTSNVSSSDAPISSTEHFTTLWMQISKNDTFKLEYVDMLAAGLEVSRATLTNVMWQSAEQIIRGAK